MPRVDRPESYYTATMNPVREFPSLEGELRADVCVIGGGYTGLSSAIHLAERGYSVVLLEAERVGWGASGRNGGQCSIGQRKTQDELEELFGREEAKRLWALGLESVATVRELIDRFGIELHAYAWMTNHTHQLVHAPRAARPAGDRLRVVGLVQHAAHAEGRAGGEEVRPGGLDAGPVGLQGGDLVLQLHRFPGAAHAGALA